MACARPQARQLVERKHQYSALATSRRRVAPEFQETRDQASACILEDDFTPLIVECPTRLSRTHYRSVVQQKAADGKVIGTSERSFTRNAERCFSSDEPKFRECQQRTSLSGN